MTHDELRRRKENADLMQRLKNGDNLCHTDLSAFRWAPRPSVKKDRKEMDRLYGVKPTTLGLVGGGEPHGDA